MHMNNNDRRIRHVIFDLDGTLLDTSEGIIESVKYVMNVRGYSKISDSELYSFVGPPLRQSFIKQFRINEQEADVAVDCFRENYSDRALLKAKPYDGIYDLCTRLNSNNIKMSVATYKPEDYATRLIEHFGFDKYFESVHGADKEGLLKKEDIILICVNEMKCDSQETVMIGDTLHDAEAAYNTGLGFIAVTYGFGFHDDSDIDKYPNIGVAGSTFDTGNVILRNV